MGMPSRIRCHCKGNLACKLCHGKLKYEYTPGPMGWQPFACPMCEGRGRLADQPDVRCFTCNGVGRVDPANPPSGGLWDDLCKILFGA